MDLSRWRRPRFGGREVAGRGGAHVATTSGFGVEGGVEDDESDFADEALLPEGAEELEAEGMVALRTVGLRTWLLANWKLEANSCVRTVEFGIGIGLVDFEIERRDVTASDGSQRRKRKEICKGGRERL